MEKRNYFTELSELETDVINEIKDELKRIGRAFSRDDEDEGKKPLEFFNFDKVSDLQKIKVDGSFEYRSGVLDENFDCDMHGLISNGDLNTADLISFLNKLLKL